MPAFYDIFVSYSHKDKDAVRGLVSALRLEGLSVCWDETSVGAFDSIQPAQAIALLDDQFPWLYQAERRGPRR